jgi:hypothetical protein
MSKKIKKPIKPRKPEKKTTETELNPNRKKTRVKPEKNRAKPI